MWLPFLASPLPCFPLGEPEDRFYMPACLMVTVENVNEFLSTHFPATSFLGSSLGVWRINLRSLLFFLFCSRLSFFHSINNCKKCPLLSMSVDFKQLIKSMRLEKIEKNQREILVVWHDLRLRRWVNVSVIKLYFSESLKQYQMISFDHHFYHNYL